jgi:transcriptional regulator with XRE-family HTH domain
MKTEPHIELIDFEVAIPNADRTKIVETIVIQVPVQRDPRTGEEILTAEALDLIENTQARHMGLLLPEQIRELRTGLGLTQRELGELLQIGEKTATRLENGRGRPSRSMNVLLCALRDLKLPMSYLQGLHQPAVDWWSFKVEEPVALSPQDRANNDNEAESAADHQSLALAA